MTAGICRTVSAVASDLSSHHAGSTTSRYIEIHAPRNRFCVEEIAKLVPPGSSICDIGAAPYVATETLARLGYAVTAYDTALPDATLASLLSFRVVKADTQTPRLNLGSELFDAVVMCEVFEHLHLNPIITMREILRILKPRGVLYLTTPNGLGLRKITKVLREGKFTDFYENWSRLESTGEMGHVTEYTPNEIRHFIRQCGFTNVQVRTENVYAKSNKIEHYFWKTLTTPFSMKRETIICTGVKAA